MSDPKGPFEAAVKAMVGAYCVHAVQAPDNTVIADVDRQAARACLAAALPPEPAPETIEVMSLAAATTDGMAAIDGLITVAAVHGYTLPQEYAEQGNSPMSHAMRAAYRALRASLLPGEEPS